MTGSVEIKLRDANRRCSWSWTLLRYRTGATAGECAVGTCQVPSMFRSAKIVESDDYSRFRGSTEIKQAFQDAGVKTDSVSPIITTCGSGVTASVLTFALHTLGKPLSKAPVYDGSWSEWGLRDDLPIAKDK
ncbi:hypothetical protein PINS_up023383 [Pythium insidiosum]|nr:hypothetical protein PINS_up023383 [Pythium insidiosum]